MLTTTFTARTGSANVIAGLGDMCAARIADAIQHAALAFSGGVSSDDTVALVLKVPRHETSGQPW